MTLLHHVIALLNNSATKRQSGEEPYCSCSLEVLIEHPFFHSCVHKWCTKVSLTFCLFFDRVIASIHQHRRLIPSPDCPPLQLASWEIYSCTVLSKTSCFRSVVLLLLTHKNDIEAVLTSAEYNSIRAPICCWVSLQLHSVV